jgi:DUF971 family protein
MEPQTINVDRPPELFPTSLKKEGEDRLVIEWNDGHRSVYTWKHLRASCPCASCREQREVPPDPFRLLKASELAPKPPLAPRFIEPIGHYAYKITWNDNHDTGIYTLDTLRALCQCDACSEKKAKTIEQCWRAAGLNRPVYTGRSPLDSLTRMVKPAGLHRPLAIGLSNKNG